MGGFMLWFPIKFTSLSSRFGFHLLILIFWTLFSFEKRFSYLRKMLGEVTFQAKRKARTFLLDDESTITATDRPPFEQFAQYPEKKHNIVRLPLPFKKHRKLLDLEKLGKEAYQSERLLPPTATDRDRKLVATPDAILGIHILEMENVSIRVTNFDKAAPMFFYMIISVGKKRKMTKVSLAHTPERVRIDASLYFPIEVSNMRDNYRNKIKFEVWAFQEPTTHYIIGSKEIHIYGIIQAVHSIEYLKIWSEGLHAATIFYEYAFAYGLFGFGHSNQLRNTKSTIFEAITHSMFPRIKLSDEEIIDNKFNIRVPKKIQMIGMSNFLLYAPENTQQKKTKEEKDDAVEPKFFSLQHVEFDRGQPVFAKVNMKIQQEEFEADFNENYGEYLCIGTRRERLDYLHELLYGRLEDIRETEVGALWENLDYDTAEDIMRAEDNPQVLVHPNTMPCRDYPAAFLEPEDEKLLETLPSLSRTSGYLARLFGYAPIESDPHYGEPEYYYTYVRGYKKHRLNGWQVCQYGLKYLWGRIMGHLWNFIMFVFPDIRTELDVPDISLTLPSPQGSTTDLFVSWVTDEREQFDHATATRRIKDPVHEAYEAVDKLLYEEYEREVRIPEHFAEAHADDPWKKQRDARISLNVNLQKLSTSK